MSRRKASTTPPDALSARLSSGTVIPLDGDLVFLIDAIYREFVAQRDFAPAYAEVRRAIEDILEQMDAVTTREYFAASLFLNFVTYENEMAERVQAAITKKAKRPTRSRRASR